MIPVVVILAIMAFLAEYSIGLMLLAAEMAHHYGLTASSYGTLGAAAFGKCTQLVAAWRWLHARSHVVAWLWLRLLCVVYRGSTHRGRERDSIEFGQHGGLPCHHRRRRAATV